MNDTWESLLAEACACEKCELCKTRTNCVFGTGNINADLLFVGEAPGDNEDKTGTPFVGRAGQLLDKYLYAVDIPRDSVYIANILKCRPPKNRDPLEDEVQACMKHLRTQVRILNPSIIVCLGRISAMRLIKPDFRITKEHGVWFHRGNFDMCAVYHPSALLRDPFKKEDMLADMKQIAQKYHALKS